MKTVLSESRRFTFDERIKRASEFKNLFKNGKRVSVVGAKLFYLPNNLKFNRIGFPLPRGFGNAVERSGNDSGLSGKGKTSFDLC